MSDASTDTGAAVEAEGAEGAAAVDGGNYDVIRRRLVEQGEALRQKAAALNEERTAIFGASRLEVVANARVRTEHNCQPCDLVQVRGCLLFGYNVYLGLKREMAVADVFSLQRLVDAGDGVVEFEAVPADAPEAAFLAHEGFVRDFTDLYKYYRETRLQQLRVTPERLMAVFRYGPSPRDLRVFHWNQLPDGTLAYVDNRGERHHQYPPQHDFEWIATTREDQVHGRHPHVSILDEVFVETVGGDLTVKLEDNTDDGLGIYREDVDDPNQTLDDARIEFAKRGGLIVMRVRPYNEERWRHLIFNTRTKHVIRADAIGASCLELPEEHGVVFPGGYYLQTGDHKVFSEHASDLVYSRTIRSPNGEDVLYVYRHEGDGTYLLLPYNLIRKEVDNAISCHGYSLFDDGRLVVFRDESDEATKVHPMQVWQTAFTSIERSTAAQAASDSKLARIGNAEIVRGISEAYTLCRLIDESKPTREVYETLVTSARRVADNVYWLGDAAVGDLKSTIDQIRQTAELIIDEFEKVIALRKRADAALREARAEQESLLTDVRPDILNDVDAFMSALTRLRSQRGHLITLQDMRYVDAEAVKALEAEVVERFDEVSQACVTFLLDPAALDGLRATLEHQLRALDEVTATRELNPITERLEEVATGLEVLSEVIANLDVDDPTERTRILEHISEVYAQLNRVRASAENQRTRISADEGRAEFAAQFMLFGQSVSSAIAVADTPEKCDEQLSRLLLTLEELEGRFGAFDEFLADLATKRDEVYQAFEAKKQQLVDARQRRIGSLLTAADRMLQSIARRAATIEGTDELNAYFAADGLVMKLRHTAEQLESLGDSVKADELLSKLKTARQDAMRGMRDRADLFEDGATTIRFGRHRFSVNTQPLELTMVPREGRMRLHLSGTDFYAEVADETFAATERFWDQPLVSETDEVYRGEHLAATIWFAAEEGDALTVEALHERRRTDGGLLALVREVAGERYDEGYDRGVHDADAAAILEAVVDMAATADRLRFDAATRAAAQLFAAIGAEPAVRERWQRRARNLVRIRAEFGAPAALRALTAEVAEAARAWLKGERLPWEPTRLGDVGRYLIEEWGGDDEAYVVSAAAEQGRQRVAQYLDRKGTRADVDAALAELSDDPSAALELALAWVRAVASDLRDDEALEAAVWWMTDRALDRRPSAAAVEKQVGGLLGQHKRIDDGTMTLRLDAFLERLGRHVHERVPAYRAYRALRQEIIERERGALRIDVLKPRVMSAFVRNRLIDEVYLPIIGDNLAKQIGASGEGKRTDLMGLLLLVSPPGYGKTTLMEYVAQRLGLVFVKVNGPSLGHGVVSLDPQEAPNATARQEVEKVNLALEMGNNVMLYVDDIQHTNPEFLQKFISLCDATRRIEGVWKGRTRTYDMRGKKFCVVMAGNPYTESGESFQIPDMLANRADIYNLGDVLSGKEAAFASSYIENALTSNPALAPVAARGMDDVYRLMDMAAGKEVAANELEHALSAVEVDEAIRVLKHMIGAREVLLRVNAEYIRSAAQDDAYREAPPFKLQGSYRNMNKIAEKIVPAMNAQELQALVDDHYDGEAQTLTTGAEANLLRLAELRDRMTDDERQRWIEIKREYVRRRSMVGDADDPVARVTGALGGVTRGLEAIGDTVTRAAEAQANAATAAARESAAAAARAAERDAARAAQERELLHAQLEAAKPQDGAGTAALAEAAQQVVPVLDRIAKAVGRPSSDQALVDALRQIDLRLATASERTKRQTAAQPAVPESPDWDALVGRLEAAMLQAAASSAPARPPAAAPAPPPPSPDTPPSPAPAGRGAEDGPSTSAVLAAVLERLDATLRALAERPVTVAASQPGAVSAAPTQRLTGAELPSDPMNASGPATGDASRGARRSGSSPAVASGSGAHTAASLDESLVPVFRSLGRQLDESRAVNARMVELIDVLKLFIQHWHRQSEGR